MGCFLGCFGSSKHRRKSNNNNKVQRNGSSNSKLEQPSVSLVHDYSKIASQNQDNKREEQLSVSSRKKVTFDSNVKAYEPVLQDEVAAERKNEEEEEEEKGGRKEEALVQSQFQSKSSSSEDSSVTSTGSYPPNHRYQNCRDSDDDEDEEIDYGDLSDDEDQECNELDKNFEEEEEEEEGMVETKGFDANHVFVEEVDDVKSIVSVSNPNARDRSVYVHPVLNPVENLTQWKVVKAKRTPPTLRPQKENAFGVKEQSFSLNSEAETSKKLNNAVPVDASLSNWLVSSETVTNTPQTNKGFYVGTPERSISNSQGSNYSVISHDDRPILGALTLEEIKQFSATSSPRKSPSRSPDEMPIIGTVGTYWNNVEDSGSASSFKGIPNTTSKYKEDKRVNWHSTPFETRLEKALNRGVAASASTYVPSVF